jgi:hypothetical protein
MKALIALNTWAAGFASATLLHMAHAYVTQGQGLHPLAAGLLFVVLSISVIYINKEQK